MDNHFLSSQTIEELDRVFQKRTTKEPTRYDFPLVKMPFGFEEILESIDTLLSGYVTMGKKVELFEDAFAKYLGVEHAIMVNSGSSANLLALAIITNPSIENHAKPKSGIIVPALTWSTSVYPIVDVDSLPYFVDSSINTLNIDSESVINAIDSDVKAIMAVHLIGNPCDMDPLQKIVEENDLFLIEDCCEAHGAEYKGNKVGTFGDIGTYSFFFSHHISTIEGGMVVTNNSEFAELARILRAHGWTRDLKNRRRVETKYEERDPRFLFVNRGYNLRPTEIQGAFGIHQIKKLDKFVMKRRLVADILSNRILDANIPIKIQHEQEYGKHSWFGFPLILEEGGWEKRKMVIKELDNLGIETRVIMGGNMADQPANSMFEYRQPVALDNAQYIDRSGILIGLHANMDQADAIELSDRVIAAVKRTL